MKPVATAYIDALNLYRRALQGTPYRWLDVRAMCEQTLANFEVGTIKYFTALVKSPKNDPAMTMRQSTYLEALQAHRDVEVHLGQFRRDRRWMEAHPFREDKDGAPVKVQVRKTEEKGSDVNLATHLVWDALHEASDAFVVLSNDSDLVTPIRRLVQEKGGAGGNHLSGGPPLPLALCMWADAGFNSVADLQGMAGQVRSDNGLKAGAVVNLTVDDTAMYVNASGYTCSRAALAVAPEVGIVPLGRDVGAVTIGDEAYQEFFIRNNDDSDPFTFGAAPTVSGQNASDFTIAGTVNECFVDVASLSPGEECSIAFRFAPSASGVRQAILSSTASPALSGPHSMFVQGTGVDAPPTPTPTTAGAPTDVVASPGRASATVSWSPPISTGSFAVTSYEVKSSPGGVTCLSTVSDCIVTGLTNGMSYTFIVRALTGAGWGPYSAASNAVVPPGDDAAPVTKSILVTGSRDGRIAKVVGQSTGLSGTSVTPFVRLRGAATFTQGAGTRPIDTDGAFTWQRSTAKQLSVYFTSSGAKSNAVTIKAR